MGPNLRARCSGPFLNLEVLHASVRKLHLNPREKREKLPWKLRGPFRNQTIHVLASSKHGYELVKEQRLVILLRLLLSTLKVFNLPKCRNPTAGLTRAG